MIQFSLNAIQPHLPSFQPYILNVEINKHWGGFLSKKNAIKIILAVLSALIAAAQTIEEKEDTTEYNKYSPYEDDIDS